MSRVPFEIRVALVLGAEGAEFAILVALLFSLGEGRPAFGAFASAHPFDVLGLAIWFGGGTWILTDLRGWWIALALALGYGVVTATCVVAYGADLPTTAGWVAVSSEVAFIVFLLVFGIRIGGGGGGSPPKSGGGGGGGGSGGGGGGPRVRTFVRRHPGPLHVVTPGAVASLATYTVVSWGAAAFGYEMRSVAGFGVAIVATWLATAVGVNLIRRGPISAEAAQIASASPTDGPPQPVGAGT
jgi:hypothetical protein